MDESYGTYVDDEYYDNHDYDDNTDDDIHDDNDHKKDSCTAVVAAPTRTRPEQTRQGQATHNKISCYPCFGLNGHPIRAVKLSIPPFESL